MEDLIEWLAAQIDLDGEWAKWLPVDAGQVRAANGTWVPLPNRARMVADAESKRLLLDDVRTVLAADPADEGALWRLRVLALPYAERPGYRDEWRLDQPVQPAEQPAVA